MNQDIQEIKIPFLHMLISAFFIFAVTTACLVTGQKDFLVGLLAVPLLVGALMPRRAVFQFLFYYFCMSLMIGQRSVHITPIIRVYPQEMIIIVLALLLLVFYHPGASARYSGRVSLFAKLFAILVVVAIFSSYENAGKGTTMLIYYDRYSALEHAIYYAKGWLIFFPIFYCVHKLVNSWEELIKVSCVLLVVTLLISANGVLERYGLGLSTFMGQPPTQAVWLEEVTGFTRSGASWWGGPMLSAALMLLFFLAGALRTSMGGTFLAKVATIAQVLCLAFIIFAGHRGVWIAFLLAVSIFQWNRGAKGFFILLILGLVAVAVIPNPVERRFQGLYGETKDSSIENRTERMSLAYGLMMAKPALGYGWGAGGLAHCDILQIGSDAGIFALIFFLVFYGVILMRLYLAFRRARDPSSKAYANAFFSALSGYLIVLAAESQLNIQEVMIVFWLFMALGDAVPRILEMRDVA